MQRRIHKGRSGLCGVVILLTAAGWLSASAADKPAKGKPKVDPLIGGMRLLPGYKHTKLQGIDSIVGKIEKAGGLTIMYEIGNIPRAGAPRFGGSFTDRPKTTPAKNGRWYKEQIVNGRLMHLAHTKNGYLFVSVQQGRKGINFSVKIKNSEELTEALLMIVTYPTKK